MDTYAEKFFGKCCIMGQWKQRGIRVRRPQSSYSFTHLVDILDLEILLELGKGGNN